MNYNKVIHNYNKVIQGNYFKGQYTLFFLK